MTWLPLIESGLNDPGPFQSYVPTAGHGTTLYGYSHCIPGMACTVPDSILLKRCRQV